MIKSIPLMLIIFTLFSSLFKASEHGMIQLNSGVIISSGSNEEVKQDSMLCGAKRKFNESSQNKYAKLIELYMRSLEKAILNFKGIGIADYHDDLGANFYDKLIRRSLDLKLCDDVNDMRLLWEMDCTSRLDLNWHVDSYLIILKNNEEFKFSEEVLIEYFKFTIDRRSPHQMMIVKETCKLASEQELSELFIEAFELIEEEAFGLKILISMISKTKVNSRIMTREWKSICFSIIKRFPRIVYSSRLRISGFKGAEKKSKQVFVHFLPIYRTLAFESAEEFEGDLDNFDNFSLFNLGNLEIIPPMGKGGLHVINEMFFESKINVTTTTEDEDLKVSIVERIFDAVLLGFEGDEIILELSKNGLFSIFESFCKYSNDANFDAETLQKLLFNLISGYCKYHEDLNFVLALIAYHRIDLEVWERVQDKFNLDENLWGFTDLFKSIWRVMERFDKFDLKSDQIIELNLSSDIIDQISNLKNFPYQLDVARVFLAKSCGIPLESTHFADHSCEGFEWEEVVGFINFHVERWAKLSDSNNYKLIKFVMHK